MFHLGPTPEDPMELLETDGLPQIHLYNGDEGKMIPWVSKTTSLGRVLVPTGEIPNQPDIPTPEFSGYIKPAIPPMNLSVLDQALAFFRFVFEANHTEAALLLALDEENNYHLYCPAQEVEYTGVDWKDNVDLEDGHYLMGSIHSHCDFSAFHSGTDTGDAAKNDGLHITMGHVDRDEPEIDVMVSFSGIRWEKWTLAEIIEGDKWEPATAEDKAQDELWDIEWLNELSEAKRWTSYGVKGGKVIHKTQTTHHGGGFGWDDEWDDWDDWDDWGQPGGWVEYKHSKPGWEKSTDDRNTGSKIDVYKRINRESNWYSDDKQMAQDQVLKDMADLTMLAQEVGMTINFNVQFREGEEDRETIIPLLAAKREEEVENADA